MIDVYTGYTLRKNNWRRGDACACTLIEQLMSPLHAGFSFIVA